jgi:hypothetical protein
MSKWVEVLDDDEFVARWLALIAEGQYPAAVLARATGRTKAAISQRASRLRRGGREVPNGLDAARCRSCPMCGAPSTYARPEWVRLNGVTDE